MAFAVVRLTRPGENATGAKSVTLSPVTTDRRSRGAVTARGNEKTPPPNDAPSGEAGAIAPFETPALANSGAFQPPPTLGSDSVRR